MKATTYLKALSKANMDNRESHKSRNLQELQENLEIADKAIDALAEKHGESQVSFLRLKLRELRKKAETKGLET